MRRWLQFILLLLAASAFAYAPAPTVVFTPAELTHANNEGLGFAYNPLGQLLSLKDGKNQETKWNYNQYGQVTNKVDATGREIIRYGYDAAGQLTNRWSAEKGDTFYRYDNLGQLTNVDYPAGMVDVTLQYDGLGRLTNAVDGLGATRFGYNDAGQLLSEDGPWADDTVSYTYANRRRSGLSLQQPSGTWTNGYRYDVYGRLTNVTSAAGSFGYVYDAQRPGLVAQILLPNGHVITQEHDALTRLTGSTLVTSNGAVRNAHGYALNVGHQRTNQVFTNATLSLAGERMGYGYDNIGQLKTAKGTQTNGTAWGTNQWGYAYDAAWNLSTRTNNGTPETFTVDSLNQLTSGGCVYDLNGNLRTNGSMVLEYDAENQLTSLQVAGSWRTEFKYDFAGRLRLRWEYTWSGAAWSVTSRTRYVYDGMLAIQERTGPGNVPLVSYTRGLDLSGSLQGAGGIGGLLARTQHTGTDAGDGYYHSDGNGNVTAILAPDGNSLLAAYLFDPYGRTLEASGVWASANVYRFSSKEHHAASGLYYYGFRFYSPDLQRWLNRDPIEEAGGINLYGFVGNGPVMFIDPFGELPKWVENALGYILYQEDEYAWRRGLEKRNPELCYKLYGRGDTSPGIETLGPIALAAFSRSPAPLRSIPVANRTPGFVHLTDQAGLAGINQSGNIMGRHGIFAVPEYVTAESTTMKVARTGLSRCKTAEFVPIPPNAQGLFQQPVPIGPYSAWKYFGGVHHAPPGVISTASGAFTPASSLIGPKALIYGPDVLFYGGAAAAGGYLLQGGEDE